MSGNTRADEHEEGAGVSGPASPTEQELSRGRDAETPFFVLGGLMVTIGAVVVLLALGLLLLWWIG